MPIIKDKYKSKSGRSTPILTRDKMKLAIVDNAPTIGQLQAEATKEARNNINVIGAGSPNVSSAKSKIPNGKASGYKIITADSIENVFTLNPNEKVNNIIISYEHDSNTASKIGLYWSLYSPNDLTAVAEGGRVTSEGELYRLLSTEFQAYTTLALNDLCEGFKNINKTIYFYGVSSTVDSKGVVYTFLIG